MMPIGLPVPANGDDGDRLRAQVAELEARNAALIRELRMLRIANGELERVALKDTLTPVFNRRYFANALNDRIARMRRYGSHCVVIFVDVNTMKDINDRHGHGAGDFALCHVAQVLLDETRSSDVVARIGGDEFALILDEIMVEQGDAKLTALAEALASRPCDFDGITLHITASFGMTAIATGDNDEEVMRRADAAMYAMKRAQRSER